MAHPKRKQSKTRTAKRRTHDKAVVPTIALCPNCGAWHLYHTVGRVCCVDFLQELIGIRVGSSCAVLLQDGRHLPVALAHRVHVLDGYGKTPMCATPT